MRSLYCKYSYVQYIRLLDRVRLTRATPQSLFADTGTSRQGERNLPPINTMARHSTSVNVSSEIPKVSSAARATMVGEKQGEPSRAQCATDVTSDRRPNVDGQDIAITMVGESRHTIDPVVTARAVRKIDWFLIPAMVIGCRSSLRQLEFEGRVVDDLTRRGFQMASSTTTRRYLGRQSSLA